ncbi:MAG: hypothetical protein GY910_16930, partial [bacterium]|nr:hypothetical protein [bacterium]
IFLISHDRALIEATCTVLLVFDGEGSVRIFNGRYSQWLEIEDRRRAEAEEAKLAAATKAAKNRTASAAKPSATKRDKPRKNAASKLAKLSTKDLESRIERCETRIREIDESMMDPDVYTDGKKTKRLQAERTELAAKLEPLEFEWSSRADD